MNFDGNVLRSRGGTGDNPRIARRVKIRQVKIEIKFLREEEDRQGDMPASLLFSLVFTDAAIAASTGIVKDVLNSLWLYLDDVTLVETVHVIIKYKVALEAELEPA